MMEQFGVHRGDHDYGASTAAPMRRVDRRRHGQLRGVGSSPQTEFLRDRLERGDDVRDVLVQRPGRSAPRRRRPRRGAPRRRTRAASASSSPTWLEPLEAGAARARTRGRSPRARRTRRGASQRRLARQAEVLRVGEHRAISSSGYPPRAGSARRPGGARPAWGGSRSRSRGAARCSPRTPRRRRSGGRSAHRRLHRHRVPEQRLALRVPRQRRPGVLAGRLHGEVP